MPGPVIYLWRKAPFIRLLLPFIAGIIIQWYFELDDKIYLIAVALSLVVIINFFFLPVFLRFTVSVINGAAICLLFIAIGGSITYHKDIRHQQHWFGHTYTDSTIVIATLEELPVEKPRSFKTEATVSYLLPNNTVIPAEGKIIIYLQKDSAILRSLEYGSQLIFKKPLQEIKNTDTLHRFDYKQYLLFQGITHQLYLRTNEYSLLPRNGGTAWTKFLISTRKQILTILRRNIKQSKEQGLAEALLIGYKNDLDRSLVQSYTNTGVVHIIAISGLHLGLIYWLLLKIVRPFQRRKRGKWSGPLFIIAGLWLFSWLAGAQPSILRSAVMFSCLVAGETLTRKTNVYNTLALSAFLLLCYNPYWLWDIGFQLSYAAILSIIIFYKPVYHLLCFKNRIVDSIWKLNAVTLAAQLLTLPVSLYHFHQFPAYFLLTNMLAVPLSSLILVAEILLCCIAFIPPLALLIGKIITWLILFMNDYVGRVESLPFSLFTGIQISLPQAILLTIFILAIGYWLMKKSVTSLKMGLIALLAFTILKATGILLRHYFDTTPTLLGG